MLREKKENKGFVNRFLDFIEVGGNKLPHPVTLFFLFCVAIILISGIAQKMGVSVTYEVLNKTTKTFEETTVEVRSLMTEDGVRYIFNSMISNFTGFAPLGTVLVGIIGIGVCEGSGLMSALIKKIVMSTHHKAITAVVVFAGVMSNIASDAGYVVLVPLGAVIFLSFGRHPLAGLAAAFAGVSGGFSANLLLGTTDPLLGGITTEAARLLQHGYFVDATANYYFMFVSTFLITILGTFVTEKIIEPRLGEYHGEAEIDMTSISESEKKGLKGALITMIIFVVVMAFCIVPENGVFRENGSLKAWTSTGLITSMMLFFLLPGIVYGYIAKTIKNDKDVAKLISDSLASMGGYMAIVFTASQFIAYFGYTNLGTVIAVKGAATLKVIGFTGLPLIVCFIILTGFINLFMGSASAKWAIMAPIFVPMLMQLGYTPEFTQLAYRIGDSTTNIISPLMSYFAMAVAFMQKYKKDGGMGTLISLMLPYSICFMIGWIILMVIWFWLGLPIGPNVHIHM
ncbi:AbgT family transporter [Fusobacterium sp.]|uniref:AbgT family transporter n=1 Tax=Fusobacterium sp. TaxID=68766 RepID=UPI0025C3714B|nr:AbgT family transporter [Fusobacterium sp.]